MPYLRVRIATANHDDTTASKVAASLTSFAVTDLGKSASAAAVDVQFTDPASWFIGGKPLTATSSSGFVVEIKITEATNSRDDKAKFVRDVFQFMAGEFGDIAKTSYVILQDVASEAWGYGGKTQEYRYITGDAD